MLARAFLQEGFGQRVMLLAQQRLRHPRIRLGGAARVPQQALVELTRRRFVASRDENFAVEHLDVEIPGEAIHRFRYDPARLLRLPGLELRTSEEQEELGPWLIGRIEG